MKIGPKDVLDAMREDLRTLQGSGVDRPPSDRKDRGMSQIERIARLVEPPVMYDLGRPFSGEMDRVVREVLIALRDGLSDETVRASGAGEIRSSPRAGFRDQFRHAINHVLGENESGANFQTNIQTGYQNGSPEDCQNLPNSPFLTKT